MYSEYAPDADLPWSAIPIHDEAGKLLFRGRGQRSDNFFETAAEAAGLYNERMNEHNLCGERNFGEACN